MNLHFGYLLVGAAMGLCRARAYRLGYLWTFDELHAACRLHEEEGFTLTRTQRGSQWGKEVNEQRFTRHAA